MSDASDKTGNLAQAMEHAKQLLDRDLQQAALQLEEILAAVPEHAPALLSDRRWYWGSSSRASERFRR